MTGGLLRKGILLSLACVMGVPAGYCLAQLVKMCFPGASP